jgi:RimJ/RimL family protein N-acetyltransferase
MAHGPANIPKKNVHIDSGDFLIRTLLPKDASDRWAAWMADPEVQYALNAPPRSTTRVEIENYIEKFDQRSSLLWGIFDKRTGAHIGFFTVHADYELSQGTVNLLIGEPEYRKHGVLSTIRKQFAEYFFETLGLKTMKASALARNEIIVNTLLKGGWKVDELLRENKIAHAGQAKLDLYLLSLSREDWRKRNHPDQP